jgi:crossover junction endodeoxyribonuclease RuvC
MRDAPARSTVRTNTQETTNNQIIVLGVDPGTRCTGWGIVTANGAGMSAVQCGAIVPQRNGEREARLFHIYGELCDLIARWRPGEIAVEDPFVGDNPRSAFAIGEARAIALLAAAQAGLSVRTYAPAEIKLAVAGYGRSSKGQVAELVRVQLGLDAAPEPSDAADALAVAICHVLRTRAERRMGTPG